MPYFGSMFFANMGGGGGQNCFPYASVRHFFGWHLCRRKCLGDVGAKEWGGLRVFEPLSLGAPLLDSPYPLYLAVIFTPSNFRVAHLQNELAPKRQKIPEQNLK